MNNNRHTSQQAGDGLSTNPHRSEVNGARRRPENRQGSSSREPDEDRPARSQQQGTSLRISSEEASNRPTHSSTPSLATSRDNTSVRVTASGAFSDRTGQQPIQYENNGETIHPVATFPQRLMDILSSDRWSDIIFWLPHGKGFVVSQKKRFANEVMPKYFSNSTKYTSFTRKLNRWNFTRVTRGHESGAYYHPLFLRDKPRLCLQMTCLGTAALQQTEPINPVALGLATPAMLSLGLSVASAQEICSDLLGQTQRGSSDHTRQDEEQGTNSPKMKEDSRLVELPATGSWLTSPQLRAPSHQQQALFPPSTRETTPPQLPYQQSAVGVDAPARSILTAQKSTGATTVPAVGPFAASEDRSMPSKPFATSNTTSGSSSVPMSFDYGRYMTQGDWQSQRAQQESILMLQQQVKQMQQQQQLKQAQLNLLRSLPTAHRDAQQHHHQQQKDDATPGMSRFRDSHLHPTTNSANENSRFSQKEKQEGGEVKPHHQHQPFFLQKEETAIHNIDNTVAAEPETFDGELNVFENTRSGELDYTNTINNWSTPSSSIASTEATKNTMGQYSQFADTARLVSQGLVHQLESVHDYAGGDKETERATDTMMEKEQNHPEDGQGGVEGMSNIGSRDKISTGTIGSAASEHSLSLSSSSHDRQPPGGVALPTAEHNNSSSMMDRSSSSASGATFAPNSNYYEQQFLSSTPQDLDELYARSRRLGLSGFVDGNSDYPRSEGQTLQQQHQHHHQQQQQSRREVTEGLDKLSSKSPEQPSDHFLPQKGDSSTEEDIQQDPPDICGGSSSNTSVDNEATHLNNQNHEETDATQQQEQQLSQAEDEGGGGGGEQRFWIDTESGEKSSCLSS